MSLPFDDATFDEGTLDYATFDEGIFDGGTINEGRCLHADWESLNL